VSHSPNLEAVQPDYARLFSVLLDIMSSLSEQSFDFVLQKITESTCQVLDADRATLFLVDEERQQIWSKVAQGASMSEIRVPIGAGIAGHVARTGETINIPDAYADARFNQDIDRRTGYRTRSILCMPMKNREGRIIGVFQVLNKQNGVFTIADEHLLAAFAAQAAIAITNARLNEELRKRMEISETLLRVMRAVSSELALDQLLGKIVAMTSEVMDAERATLFLLDRRRGDLWSKVAQGIGSQEIRVPLGVGIVGHVAGAGETVNIADVYRDARFNPEVDRRTGYRTRNMLCMPLRNESAEIVGVIQVLNKRNGPFTGEDEELLNALGSQTSIALENSRLFEEVQYIRNYNESILRTMASGVVTLGSDGTVAFCNAAARVMFADVREHAPGEHFHAFFNLDSNLELGEGIERVLQGEDDVNVYAYCFRKSDGEEMNMNIHAMPLRDAENKSLGVVLVADDITQEQKLMSTLCRYVTRSLAEQILKDRDKLKLGGKRSKVTVLFSDIRNFTTISEQSSAEEIVGMLNEYFSRMMEPIFKYDGMLDKFIGDAMMAVFGAPVPREDDAMCAVMAALEMRHALRRYNRYRVLQGHAPIEIGVGITKGEVISGNIGSEQRMDYTVIGDTVNVASRLEGLTKNYECKILINEQVYREVKDKIVCVDLGLAQVKGKGDTVHIFGVPDPAEQRRYDRVSANFAVSYGMADHLYSGQATDISEGGVAFKGPQMFPTGGDLDVHCRLLDEWVAFHGKVRQVAGTSIGVEFVEPTEAQLNKVRAFLGSVGMHLGPVKAGTTASHAV
jgi:adenylate cyclase